MALTKISTGMLKQDAASSDLNIDAGTLFLDVSNNRVGIANTSPSQALDVTGNAVFSGSVTVNAGVVVDNITIDGNEIDVGSGDLTLDVAGNINLDADGANVYFNDGGTERYRFKLDATPEINVTGGTFTLKNNTSDADILFSGNDGGSAVTALTLDMSNAGAATFNSTVTSTGLTVEGNSVFTTADNSAQVTLISTDTDALVGPKLNLWRNSGTGTNGDLIGEITFTGEDTVGSTNIFASISSIAEQTNNGAEDGSLHFNTLLNGTLAKRLSIGSASTGGDISFYDSSGSSQNLYWDSSTSRLGLGTTNPAYPLDVASSNATSIAYQRTGVSAKKWAFNSDNSNTYWANETDNILAMTLSNAGNASFSGAVTSTGLTVDGGTASPIINLSRSGTYSGITFSQTVTNVTGAGADLSTYSLNANTGYVWQTCDSGGTTAKALLIAPNRDISFYNDSAAQGLFWDSSTSRLGLGTTVPASLLHIQGNTDTADSFLTIEDADPTTGSQRPHIKFVGNGTQLGKIRVLDNGTGMQFLTGSSDNIRLAIDSSGSSVFSGAVTSTGLTVNGANAALMSLIAPTDNATFALRAGNSDSGVEEANIAFYQNNAAKWQLGNGTDNSFKLYNYAASNYAFTVASTGNVNIPNGSLMVGSTTAPSHKIHVQTDTNALTSLINIDNKHSSGSGGALIFTQNSSVKARIKNYFSGGWNLGFDTEDTTDALTIADNGNATFSGSVTIPTIAYVGTSIVHQGDSDTSIDFQPDVMDLYSGGSLGVRVQPTAVTINEAGADYDFRVESNNNANMLFVDGGNNRVGIATSSPQALLHIQATSGLTPQVKLGQASAYQLQLGYNNSSEYGFLQAYAVNLSTPDDIVLNPSGGNVGIGTSSPVTRLHSVGSEGEVARIGSGSVAFSLGVGHTGNGTGYLNLFPTSSPSTSPTSLAFQMGGTERMRIDSSGNLLVGLTSISGIATGSTADNGVYVDGSVGAVVAQSSANRNLYCSKASGYSDPDFISFQVGGANVGSIGTYASRLYIGNSDTSLTFEGAADKIYPATSTGAGRDNAIDLGGSSSRFKDLYLSSGVYLGGTGSANKLDDYEEGTWTPVLTDLTNNATMHSLNGGVYTKIGRLVTCTANVRTTSLGSVSGGLYLSGFPFSSANTNGNNGAGSVANAENMSITTGHAITLFYGKNSNIARFDIYDHSGGITVLQSSEWTSDGQACISVTYFTA